MSNSASPKVRNLTVSKMAGTLIGSEIIKLAAEVNEKIKNGETIFNLTIGDFNSKIFPIPEGLKNEIIAAYINNETNYPAADGVLELRKAVSNLIEKRQGIKYETNEILIAGGARPIIYAIYRTLIDSGDKILFPVPSWNNNHYTHLSTGDYNQQVLVETRPENNFMPTAKDLAPHLSKVAMVSLCSPLNPTGTTFSKKDLEEICDLILAENERRGPNEKPLYLLYDQIYWALTFGEVKHHDPVSLRPEMRNYTIFVDGISKSLASTGVRVGWAMGPKTIIDSMKSILSHVGAWAPKAEQVATAKFLEDLTQYDAFIDDIKTKVNDRLVAFHAGFQSLKSKGYRVNSIAPQAAIYLTVQFSLHGQKTAEGKILESTKDVTKYILDEAKLAVVPFYAFGASTDSDWYRLSVGTCKMEDVKLIIESLDKALAKLS